MYATCNPSVSTGERVVGLIPAHLIAIALGFWVDRFIGDPPTWPHPVRWIGSFIYQLTAFLNKPPFRILKGAFLWGMTVSIVVIPVTVIVWLAYDVHVAFGIVVEALFIAIGLAQKSLRDAALAVHIPLVAEDITEARTKLSWIVGRDTDQLPPSEIARGTIETVSENTADGITSPLFWAFLFGAPGLWLYKAVNTMDSMIGYRDERYAQFGKVAARMDDAFNYIPARLTGVLILCCTPNHGSFSWKERWHSWRRDAKQHTSPNSGFLEAATAWQLGIRLGGESTYRGRKSTRPFIGPLHEPPQPEHMLQAITQMHRASIAFWLLGTMFAIGVVWFTV